MVQKHKTMLTSEIFKGSISDYSFLIKKILKTNIKLVLPCGNQGDRHAHRPALEQVE